MSKPPMRPAEFEKELAKDVEIALAEDMRVFKQKFATIELSLQQVNVTIQQQSDRVIEEVLAGIHAGPYEQIMDKVPVSPVHEIPFMLTVPRFRICTMYGRRCYGP